MRAQLRYVDCLGDDRTVMRVLSSKGIEILKTRRGMSIYPRITIRIKNNEELNKLLLILNNYCLYAVNVVKVSKYDSFFDFFKKKE